MPCRYTKSPWYVYMKAKTRFVESMRLVNTFRVFKFTTQSVNDIWKILSTLFVLNHWSDKKVDLWGLWGGGGVEWGAHFTFHTPPYRPVLLPCSGPCDELLNQVCYDLLIVWLLSNLVAILRWWTADFEQVPDTLLYDWCSYNNNKIVHSGTRKGWPCPL